MISRVLISKSLLSSFRKLVLEHYPNEVMNTLWGRVEGDTVLISALKTPEQNATDRELTYYDADAISPQTQLRGEHYLGTIHSHPDCVDATPSQHDWDTAYSSGERVFGVMRVSKQGNKFKMEVKFWEPRPEITVVHPRVRKAVGTSSGTSSVRSVVEVGDTEKGEPVQSRVTQPKSTTTSNTTTGVTHYEDRDSKSQTEHGAVQIL